MASTIASLYIYIVSAARSFSNTDGVPELKTSEEFFARGIS
jgi:hypothetical protein